jgi:hypothetical protein
VCGSAFCLYLVLAVVTPPPPPPPWGGDHRVTPAAKHENLVATTPRIWSCTTRFIASFTDPGRHMQGPHAAPCVQGMTSHSHPDHLVWHQPTAKGLHVCCNTPRPLPASHSCLLPVWLRILPPSLPSPLVTSRPPPPGSSLCVVEKKTCRCTASHDSHGSLQLHPSPVHLTCRGGGCPYKQTMQRVLNRSTSCSTGATTATLLLVTLLLVPHPGPGDHSSKS